LSIKDAEKSIEMNPKWWKSYYRKATSLYYLKKYEESYKFWKEAYTLEKNDILMSFYEKIKEKLEIERNTIKRDFYDINDKPKSKNPTFTPSSKKR
jgi:tetratricopeptide (TPR) repeat protein